MRRIVNAFFSKLDGGKRGCAVFALCAATAIALPAQTFTTLDGFDSTDGEVPYAGGHQAVEGHPRTRLTTFTQASAPKAATATFRGAGQIAGYFRRQATWRTDSC